MSRVRMFLSLPSEIGEALGQLAEQERTLPATLAARIIQEEVARRLGGSSVSEPYLVLTEWLAERVDAVREGGMWTPTVIIDFFDEIERDALPLYEAAQAQLGRLALNSRLGRFIRTRLGAEAALRNGRPHIARVPVGRSRLIQTVTLLQERAGEHDA